MRKHLFIKYGFKKKNNYLSYLKNLNNPSPISYLNTILDYIIKFNHYLWLSTNLFFFSFCKYYPPTCFTQICPLTWSKHICCQLEGLCFFPLQKKKGFWPDPRPNQTGYTHLDSIIVILIDWSWFVLQGVVH